MCDPSTAPAEACAPDADRAGPDSPDLMPQWLAILVAMVILFVIRRLLSLQERRNSRAGAGAVNRVAPGREVPQARATSVRGRSGDATEDDTSENADCPKLPRALAAFLDAAAWPEADMPPQLLPEASGIPGGVIAATRKAASTAVSHGVATAARFTPAAAGHAAPPALWWRMVFARAGTGPPAASGRQSLLCLTCGVGTRPAPPL